MAVAEIAERLRSVRENLGLTQVEFAEQIGAQLRTYKRWEQGHSELPASAFFAIETAFNVSSKWLFTGQGLIMGRNLPARPIDDDQAHGIANKVFRIHHGKFDTVEGLIKAFEEAARRGAERAVANAPRDAREDR